MPSQKHTHRELRTNISFYRSRLRQESTSKAMSSILIFGAPPWASVQAPAMPNSSSPSTGMVTICMDKQKYSAAAGFHIQLFHFLPSPKARPQQKSKKVRQHHPTGHQLNCSVIPASRGFFYLTVYVGSYLLLSLLSFFLPPVIHWTFWKQTEKGASTCRKGTHHDFVLPLTAIPAAVQSSDNTATALSPGLPLSSELQGWQLKSQPSYVTLRDTGERIIPLKTSPHCEPCIGSKDVNPQGFAPLYAWPWPSSMGWCLCQRVALIPNATCHGDGRRNQKKVKFIPSFSYMCGISPQQPIHRLQNCSFLHTSSALLSEKKEA